MSLFQMIAIGKHRSKKTDFCYVANLQSHGNVGKTEKEAS